MRQTIKAARETIQVSKKVTNMTQTLLSISDIHSEAAKRNVPICISKRSCVVVNRRRQHSTNHQKPINKRNIELTMENFRRVDHLDLRKV